MESEIGGIEKRKGGDGGIQYAFRGIDAISAAAQPLLGKYGVVIVPVEVEHSIKDITVNGKPWTDGTVMVTWNIYGPGGVTDVIVAQTVGMGRDNSEKSYPKAITQAYKNLLLRVLCIGDPDDDTDGYTHERDGRATVDEAERIRAEAAHVEAETERQARLEEMWPKFADVGSTPRGALLQETARAAGLKLTKKDLWANPEYQARVEWVMAADNDQVEVALAEIRDLAETEKAPEVGVLDGNS